MKLPTSTKPTSGFHICDILELNKDKQQKKRDESPREDDDEEKSKLDENCDDDKIDLKRENLSCESDENLMKSDKRKHSPSPTTSPTIARDSSLEFTKESRKSKKQLKHDDDRSSFDSISGHQQLLNETLHQYPHLFQNHPAMRPWFNSNGKF